MESELVKVALRCNALYLEPQRPEAEPVDPDNPLLLSAATVFIIEQLALHGFRLEENALRMLNRLCPEDQADILAAIKDVFGTNLNWMPLVKDWQEPVKNAWGKTCYTGFFNFVCDKLRIEPSDCVKMPCGHLIPPGVFDLERYNGCPCCGRPFRTADFVVHSMPSSSRLLRGWSDEELYSHFKALLESRVPLDASQRNSLRTLLDYYEVPEGVEITMRESVAEVVLSLLEYEEITRALEFIKTPADVLRTLWYGHTGRTQVIKPRVLVRAAWKNARHMYSPLDCSDESAEEISASLRLKYTRRECRLAAKLLNGMEISPEAACETMHPNRGMWVRFIRALRLAEYAKKSGYERLRKLLDVFYRGDYKVLQGRVDTAMRQHRYLTAVQLLSTRPGLFARQLFSQMLTTDPEAVLAEFRKVVDKLPARLVYSLGNAADTYFFGNEGMRTIRTITGIAKDIPVNPRLDRFTAERLEQLVESIKSLTLDAIAAAFAGNPDPGRRIFIDPALYSVPLPVGDRSNTISAMTSMPQGTSFPVSGSKVRVFLQWGKGLKAAPIDLDISAVDLYPGKTDTCAYFNLTATGMQHSGDMRAIPDDVGTAEYIEVNIDELDAAGALYVAFTMNAYTNGAINPNTMAGWMDSAFEMKIDEKTGVAYDPACVEHLIKIDNGNISKGMLFALLDVPSRQMIWIEMPFDNQTVQSLSLSSVLGILRRLRSKISIGKALEVMAEARGMQMVDRDGITDDTLNYTRQWASDAATVANELFP